MNRLALNNTHPNGFSITPDHWLTGVCQTPSPNCNDRPWGIVVDLIVLHAISLPAGSFGGGAIRDLFQNRLDPAAHPDFAALTELRVSSHLLIDRRGAVEQFVPLNRRAWHAGRSCYRGRSECNDFSIGIELEGCDTEPFTEAQYEALFALLDTLFNHYPTLSHHRIVGHAEIAPVRKTDPGPYFEWWRLYQHDFKQHLKEAA